MSADEITGDGTGEALPEFDGDEEREAAGMAWTPEELEDPGDPPVSATEATKPARPEQEFPPISPRCSGRQRCRCTSPDRRCPYCPNRPRSLGSSEPAPASPGA